MTYICEKCNKRVEGEQAYESNYPEHHDNPGMIELLEGLRKDMGRSSPEFKHYHLIHEYMQWGGTARMAMCGPLHPETEVESFVHWLHHHGK